MTCWIRKRRGDVGENYVLLGPNEWDLRAQVALLAEWLQEKDGKLVAADGWIADIGFNVRVDASGGGPIITSEIMSLCLRNNVEIYLSEYGLEDEGE